MLLPNVDQDFAISKPLRRFMVSVHGESTGCGGVGLASGHTNTVVAGNSRGC
jgi:hypothetical protein